MSNYKFFVCLIMGLFLIFATISLVGGETKISMKLWNRYTYETSGGEVNASEIALKRGYFRIEPKLTDKIDGRFNLDFYSEANALNAAGLRVKYAYLNFAEVLPIPESKISVGLIQHYFGFGYDWAYITIEKVLEEVEGVATSADYGIAFCGNIPGDKGVYSISVLNGEGYTRTGRDLDNIPEFLGNLRIAPVGAITLGGSLLYEKDDSDRLAYIALGRLDGGIFELWGEYLVRSMNDVTSNGFMVMSIIKLRELTNIDADIIGRFDMWDINNSVDNDSHMRIIAGLNWNILRDANNIPQTMLQIQAQREIFESNVDDIDRLMVQLQWGFSNTFVQ